jgi:glycosyltransferase involved in cell wall biosynthesis
MEAMLLGNPIISTNCGGIHEYLTHKKDAYLLDCDLIPIENVSYNPQWYTPDQKWAEPKGIREALRWVYKTKAIQMGINGSETVKIKFNLDTVGKTMRQRLEQIQATL